MSDLAQLWDKAQFEQVAAIDTATLSDPKELQIVAEARAAVKLAALARGFGAGGGVKMPANSPMKIMTVLHSTLPHHTGGYTSRAHGLLTGLHNHGVQLASYSRPGFYTETLDPDALPPFPKERVDDVIYRHLPTEIARAEGEYQYMLAAVGKYREALRKEDPNVLHLRSTYVIALPALIAAHSLGIPVLYEVSGIWDLVFEGRRQYGLAARAAAMEDLTLTNADRIVTMNGAMAKLLNERNGGDLDIGLVPNAVNPERFAGVTPLKKVATEAYDIGYIGSLVDYEGLTLLVQAVSTLRDQGENIRVKIVGQGKAEPKIEAAIEKFGVADLVHLKGNVPSDEVIEQFNDIKMVVLPRVSTPATENVTPLKPFEAMAARRPLIVSDVAAMNEVANGGATAEVFTAGRSKALAEAIMRVRNSEERQNELVDNAYKLVTTKHSWDTVSGTMEKELRSVATTKSPLPLLDSTARAHQIGQLSLAEALFEGKR